MKKWNRILAVALVFVTALGLSACNSQESPTGGDGGGTKKIGYVVAGPDDYYNVSAQVVEKECEKLGWEATVLNSEYNQAKELSNVEDLIAKDVDGILILVANGDSSQRACKLANDAGVPIVFVASEPNKGEGKPDSVVSANWTDAGITYGELIAEKYPGSKVAIVAGVAGQNISDVVTTSLTDTLKEKDPTSEIVELQYGEWTRGKALEVTQDILASGKEIDIFFFANEEMCAGGVKALEEAGKNPDDYIILSANGKDIGLEMIEQGWLDFTIEFAPTTEAYYAFHALKGLIEGKDVKSVIDNPGIELTRENLSDAITWDPEQFCNEDYKQFDLNNIFN